MNRSAEVARDAILRYEGKKIRLYQDPHNPYESIYITAGVEQKKLTLLDEEYEHGPDGGYSYETFEFDEENTEKVFMFLCESELDPMDSLAGMLDYANRTRRFLEECNKRGIVYIRKLFL